MVLSNTSPESQNGISPANSSLEAKERGAVDAPDADRVVVPGEMSFEEVTAGGMGRHLGLFSTTLLMYVGFLSD